MNVSFRKLPAKLRSLFIAALLLSLLAGCASSGGPQPSPGMAADETASPDTYDIYHQDTVAVRKDFDDLCQRFMLDQLSGSFLNLHYTLLDPEKYGVTDYERTFGDFSLESMKEERQRQKDFMAEFSQIDSELLSEDQLLTYQILMEAFHSEDAGDNLELYYQPLAPSTGIQAQLPILLGEFALRNRQDVEDYLTLLSDIDEYYRQILDFERAKSQAGLFMTDACVDQIVEECGGYLLPADHNFMTSIFNQRIDEMEDLSDAEKTEYKSRNLTIVTEHFIPAYQLLTDGLLALKGTCTNEQGLCYYPDGADYYEYLVRSSTGTTCETIEELRDAISAQIDEDLMAMSQILKEHPETADEIDGYSFSLTDPSEILEHLKIQAAEDFPEIPDCRYTAKTVPEELSHTLGPAFFLVPPIDDYNNCIIYINPDSTSDSQALYTTLAHEGIPGHMYQNVYFLSKCKTDLRKVLSFTAYSEGWAVYVENYSYTTDNGLSPELGQLLARNAAASLGIHALMDVNINYFGWTKEQVKEFLEPYFDTDEDSLIDTVYNTMLNTPVNYLDYYVGYLEILHMKNLAEETLGRQFSLKKFHQFLLDIGPAPFTVINEHFHTWLLTGGALQ